MEGEARVVLRCMDRRIPPGHPTGCDFTDVADHFVGSNKDLRQFRVALGGWGDAVYEGMSKTTGIPWWNFRRGRVT